MSSFVVPIATPVVPGTAVPENTPAAVAQPVPQQPVVTPVECPAELDLVFCIDCTGSMSSYIHAVQTNVQSILTEVHAQDKCDVQCGLVSYRDHPPQDSTYVTRVFPWTKDLEIIKKHVNTMSASGGGDGPEAVCCGLHAALHFKWRPNSAKVVVLIADAPPHGLGENGDGFPNGCPDSHDPLDTARKMLEAGITVYTVACEPALGYYNFGRDFMVTVADITQGQAIALSNSALLTDVILGGAREEIALARLMQNMDVEVSRAEAEVGRERAAAGLAPTVVESDSPEYETYSAQVQRSVATSMARAGTRTSQLRTDSAIAAPNAPTMKKAGNLSDWRSAAPRSAPAVGPQSLRSAAAPSGAACPPAPPLRSAGGFLGMFGGSARRSSKSMPADTGAHAELDGAAMPMPCCSVVAAAPGGYGGSAAAEISLSAVSSATHVSTVEDTISYEQVGRMMKRSAASRSKTTA